MVTSDRTRRPLRGAGASPRVPAARWLRAAAVRSERGRRGRRDPGPGGGSDHGSGDTAGSCARAAHERPARCGDDWPPPFQRTASGGPRAGGESRQRPGAALLGCGRRARGQRGGAERRAAPPGGPAGRGCPSRRLRAQCACARRGQGRGPGAGAGGAARGARRGRDADARTRRRLPPRAALPR
ncbi:proapoptotic nucleolar protein 1-like [Oenanthe melanoleuca]|uniref:proapoptotic nucleolar protein 1-like n=1 Tax=Oenanthe melanoleuca TaxID=2939378 RepID=UPI0024C16A3D|nr:proapoptotic nucleolar protein 1-like [Oenanthe melanoleuca]